MLAIISKLSQLIAALPSPQEPRPFLTLRNLLAQRRLILLPSLVEALELPAAEPHHVRARVTLDLRLIDGDSGEQLAARWIGQAEGPPLTCYERAITQGLEDFLTKTLWLYDTAHTATPERELSAIRRTPQPPSPLDEAASQLALLPSPPDEAPQPEQASQDDPQDVATPQPEDQPEPVTARKHQVAEVAVITEVAKPIAHVSPPSDDDADHDPTAWKAANALWRALVSEVCSAEVMAAYEAALEARLGVDSWRLVPAHLVREQCQQLRRRSTTPSDARRLSDREEHILSQLPTVPPGASLERAERELRRLVEEVSSPQTADDFISLYLEKLGADAFAQVAGRSLIAMCRKLRRFRPEERDLYVRDVLGQAQEPQAPSLP